MTTTDFQHVFAAEINLGRRLVVERNAEPVRLVRLVERWADRRVLLVLQFKKTTSSSCPSRRVIRGYQYLKIFL
jgi:hypothetical protein